MRRLNKNLHLQDCSQPQQWRRQQSQKRMNGQLWVHANYLFHLRNRLVYPDKEKECDLKQDENHETEKLEQEILVAIEAQHHLLFLIVPFPALFYLLGAEVVMDQVRYVFVTRGTTELIITHLLFTTRFIP